MGIILRDGGIYRSRRGDLVAVADNPDDHGSGYPFITKGKEGEDTSFTRNGFVYSETDPCPRDLIEEVSAPVPTPQELDAAKMLSGVGVSLKTDNVNHPKHYNSHPSGVECIQIREWLPSNIADVFKYLWRAGLKDSAPTDEDYNKAAWYLLREFKRKGVKLTVSQEVIEALR